jgi:hypothetical protein
MDAVVSRVKMVFSDAKELLTSEVTPERAVLRGGHYCHHSQHLLDALRVVG